jgi:hypothetical protein
VLGGRVRDLVAQYGREPGVVLGERQDPGVDHDLPAREAVGVGLVLAEERHLPDERRLVVGGDGLDALRDALHLLVLRARRDDPSTVLAEGLRVLLVSKRDLLLVGELHALRAVGDRGRLAVGVEHHQADDPGCEREGDEGTGDEDADYRFPEAAHLGWEATSRLSFRSLLAWIASSIA